MTARNELIPNVGSAHAQAPNAYERHLTFRPARAERASIRCPKKKCIHRWAPQSTAFTLVELLVVLAIIGSFTIFLFGGLKGASNAAALRSAQGTLGGLVTVARTQAIATGRSVRILVNIDPLSASDPSRFLRYIVVQTQSSTGWQTITDAFLPGEVYLVPGDFTPLPAGLFASEMDTWVHVDGATLLRSTALRTAQISTEPVESETAQKWVSIAFSPTGTTAQSGDLILAEGRNRAPGSFTLGQAPIELLNRDHVCGVTLSSYGVAVAIGDRASF